MLEKRRGTSGQEPQRGIKASAHICMTPGLVQTLLGFSPRSSNGTPCGGSTCYTQMGAKLSKDVLWTTCGSMGCSNTWFDMPLYLGARGFCIVGFNPMVSHGISLLIRLRFFELSRAYEPISVNLLHFILSMSTPPLVPVLFCRIFTPRDHKSPHVGSQA